MQLIDNRCPNCMGVVKRIPGTNVGECESCGSRFTLAEETVKAAAADAAGEDVDEDDDDEEGSDLEEFFDDFIDSLDDDDDDRDYSVGVELESGKGARRFERGCKYFEIDDGVTVYLVLDTTLMGSGKIGFAIGDDGFYCRDEDGDVGYLNWDDFDEARIEVEGTNLTVAGYKFTTTPTDADTLFEMLCDLQEL